MSDDGSFPSGYGHEWRGDWQARLLGILGKKGHSSLTSFVRARPLATMNELVAAIGDGDVAPVQLKWRLVEEARASNTLRECALDLLVRFLRGVADGWPSDLSWEGLDDVRAALITWQLALDDEHCDDLLGKMADELLDATDISPGWIPSGVDDPRLASLFDRHWPQEG